MRRGRVEKFVKKHIGAAAAAKHVSPWVPSYKFHHSTSRIAVNGQRSNNRL
jgi:hypothetical protein